MKKIVSYFTLVALMVSVTACGAKSESTVPSASVTTANAVEVTAAAETTVTTAAGSVTDTAKEDITLDEADYLFGGYVALESGSIKMFSAPDKGANVLTEIPYSTQLDIYSSGTDGWYKTGFDGKAGFVEAKNIKEIESYDEDMNDPVPEGIDHEEIAVSKMDDLNVIIRLTNVMYVDGLSEDYIKVEEKGIKSVDDLKQFINDTCSGDVKDEFLDIINTYPDCYKEKDGELYFNPAPRGFPKLLTGGGVDIDDPAMNYFTATTKEDDEMNSLARAVFHFDGENWTIQSYEFGDFIKVKISDSSAVVRTDTDDNANVIEELGPGTVIEVNTTYDNEWYSISYPEQIGYLRRSDVEPTDDRIAAEDFLGMWYCGRLWAQIEKAENGYHVYIKWSWSPADGIVYEYNCFFDEATSVLRCSDSGTAVYYCADDAEPTEADHVKYEYNDGSAIFEIKDGNLYWTDGKEEGSEPQMFAR